MPKVLLIEDDRELGGQITTTLEGAGFEVTWWTEGKVPDPEGLDLVIVDLMLPGMYGLDILKALRAESDLPVLVLSARTDTSDKIRALKLGADDYLTKPFWPDELVERAKARLRRPFLARSEELEVGPLKVHLDDHRVTLHGRPLDLTPTERALLTALARRRGAAVTRGALVDALDAQHDGAERNLDVHISRLRKKLGDPALVETVWGVGYRLAVKSPA
ncbi:MAG: response regulator transcription factor [Myxococcales bacterium]|nr:response regulator transcription factor [Myxococcales bacterium]MCB9649039.1 response regulator transcription factor [Deltaproteobacteria bacterium]